jgi:hypothetical protein
MNAAPQIALVNARCWAVIGPYFSHTGLTTLWPMPQVDCPILDTSLLSEESVRRILGAYAPTPAGVEDVDALVDALVLAGARLLMPLPQTMPIAQTVSQ